MTPRGPGWLIFVLIWSCEQDKNKKKVGRGRGIRQKKKDNNNVKDIVFFFFVLLSTCLSLKTSYIVCKSVVSKTNVRPKKINKKANPREECWSPPTTSKQGDRDLFTNSEPGTLGLQTEDATHWNNWLLDKRASRTPSTRC